MAAVQGPHTLRIPALTAAQERHGDILARIIFRKIAVFEHLVIDPVDNIQPLLVGHRKPRRSDDLLQVVQQVGTRRQQLRIACGHCREFLGRVVRIVEHRPEVRDVYIGDVAHEQHRLLHTTGAFDEVMHLPQRVVIFFRLLVNLYRLLKTLKQRTSVPGCFDDLLGGIHDTLRQIRGVAHHPLRPKRMTCQQHRCQQAEAYSPSHRTGA